MGDTTSGTPTMEEISRSMWSIEAELREIHGDPVYDGDDKTVFADSTGHELNEIAKEEEVDRSELSEWMHEQARDVDYDWSASDPVVILRD